MYIEKWQLIFVGHFNRVDRTLINEKTDRETTLALSPYKISAKWAESGLTQKSSHEFMSIYLVNPSTHSPAPPIE